MTNRIFRSIFLVAFAVMLSVTTLIMGVMYSYASVERHHELRREVAYIGALVEREGLSELKDLADSSVRVTWINQDGAVLYDSVAAKETMENHADRKEVREALTNGTGESERYSATLLEKTWYYALRLDDGTVIRLSVQDLSVFAVFHTIAYPLVLILVLVGGVSLFFAFRTAKMITKPINEIDLKHPDRAEVYEELTPLLHRIAVQNKEIYRQMAELKRRKEEFDTITANMQEGLLVLDAEGDVLSHNEGAVRLLGLSQVEEGKNVLCLNRSEGFRRGVEHVLAGEHCEERLELNGRICQLFANPVLRDGESAGAILILFDVTEKEERERLRREFTANVSHELKTPLTSISGFAEIMKNGLVRPEDMGHFAGKIYDEAQRLIALIQDIIKLSKLDEGDSLLERKTVDLGALVREVCERLRPQAEKKGVHLSVSAELAQLQGVEQVLSEMVYNLCDNAIRYTPADGEVRVSLQKQQDALMLEVADTGIGIAKEEQERIFERFYRVDAGRSADQGGTGLGLSIVKHGAMLHGGRVFVESEVGKGTKMRVRLPL